MAVGNHTTQYSDSLTSAIASTNKDALEHSTKMVDHYMRLDHSCSELVDCLKMGGELPAVSGLNDQDYPGGSELGLNPLSLSQLTLLKKVPLPPDLADQFRLMQSSFYMGLFPEIGRAWITIDTNLFMWNFNDGSDLAYYDGITETILCTGLVRPKQGVFQSSIHYLLCLATSLEIVLLGVSFSSLDGTTSFDEMHLLPEPLFTYSTDNTAMTCFLGSDQGRIFLGAQDGCVYEFTYQDANGWFRRKFRKINHCSSALSFLFPSFLQFSFTEDDPVAQLAIDNSRNILYGRSVKGSLTVFDLGVDGTEMRRCASMNYQSVVNSAVTIAKTIDKKDFSPIVHISAVESSESQHVNLVAVTQSGVRFYFTTNVNAISTRPYTLALLHVRLPPGRTANSTIERPTNVRCALYRKGFFILTSRMADDQDALFTMSNDFFVFHSHLRETSTALGLESLTWSLAEIPTAPQSPEIFVSTKFLSPVECPLLVTQHAEKARLFVILSSQGCSILSKPRPVDYFKKLLLENRGPDCEDVKAFFRLHKEAQACAMCLILSCSQNPQDRQVSEWATRAFFMYGGVPSITVGLGGTTLNPVNPAQSTLGQSVVSPTSVWASTPIRDQSYLGRIPVPQFSTIPSPVTAASTPATLPVQSPSTIVVQPQQQQPQHHLSTLISCGTNSEITFSGKHDGLHLYFSRVIWPLWNSKFIETIKPNPQSSIPMLVCTVTSEQLASFLQQLSALKNFVAQYQPHFGGQSNGSHVSPPTLRTQNVSFVQDVMSVNPQSRKAQSDAELQERISLLNLKQLISYTQEVLGLWKILCDHHFESFFSLLPLELRNPVQQMTLKEFVIEGRELCSALANAVIKFYLEDNASTHAISQKLREVCPSIYRTEDAIVSKAQEIVLQATPIFNKVEREKKLMEALKLCKTITAGYSFESLCVLFHDAQFYYGIVDLCLSTAQRVDPQGLGLHYYQSGEPQDDLQGRQLYESRLKCYQIVLNNLNELVTLSTGNTQSPIMLRTSIAGEENGPKKKLTPEEAKKYSEVLFEIALKTDDELFHTSLYSWLIDNSRTDTLLSVNSHYLENFLKRKAEQNPQNLKFMDLLWKFYEKNKNFTAAARVLAKLADRSGPELSLSQRLEYLSRAIMCVKSTEVKVNTGEGEFLHELQEKMEVARIQLRILEAVQQKRDANVQASISKLNSSLLNISELFEEFAVPHNFSEIKLAILHCAAYHDSGVVESLWQSILEKELAATSGNLSDTRVEILQQRLQTISQPYIMSEKFFPIVSIIQHLELRTCVMDFNRNWVYQTMRQLGFSLVDLLNIYHKLYRSRDTCWLTVDRPLHLLKVLSLITAEFVNSPSSIPSEERRAFVTLCLDVIAGYLVDLQSMSASDPIVSLIRDFKSVQHKLERLL